MQRFVTDSVEETIELGKRLASRLTGGTVVAFFGGLGMGKTAFTRGMAKALNTVEEVSSPTFAIVNAYGGNPPLYHFDMYRVESWDDLYSSGFFDYYESGGILAVEWSENIENALPENTVRVIFERGENENQRIITVDGGVNI
ncbi:MAG: tRNA (adenosine(37)-N6)-threonylcarbamoyltransferase complex ATPase subunit type 1 TsaE [Oscillospiraceae bacterium]|nr:tRNA (adenosine(37)-N6)-threonylcarbamoyltransferase complex ATPase subunit type 1 TsaE [Oscillospiraceae bacterium]